MAGGGHEGVRRVFGEVRGDAGGDCERWLTVACYAITTPRACYGVKVVELNIMILNAVDRITCHWQKEKIYSKKEFDLDGFDQSQ